MISTTTMAERTRQMDASAIREILKVVSRPGMISLAGGIPAPESFPMEILKQLTAEVLDRYGSRAFQYDPTEGFPPLQETLSEYLSRYCGISASPDEILVGSGSQGVLDALGKVVIGRGDMIAVEAPTYLGAIQAFNPYGPEYISLDTDDDGLLPASLDRVLSRFPVKMVYLVPTFQNPSGRTISLSRRIEIAEIIQKHHTLLVEDDPYGLLRYHGEHLPPIKSLAPENTVYIGTMSKVMAPGLRVGFCLAPETIRHWLVIAKQGVDLHTGTFSQAVAAAYLSGGHLERHLPKIIDLYKPKLSALLTALEIHLPADFRWSKPEGGMFVWVEGSPGLDTQSLYWKAVENNVAFVPGEFFFTRNGEGRETMRLNFTMADEASIHRAVATLAEVIRECTQEQGPALGEAKGSRERNFL